MTMSSIGWIDFSSEHRNKVRAVLDLLRDKGVVDELGIGVVRDALADVMFPGISTIQTRAKYFTLTALLIRKYTKLSDAQRQKLSLEDHLAREEQSCRIQLYRRYRKLKEGEGLGITGISFKEREDKDVQRPPSIAYWNGLRQFGLVDTELSLSEYGQRLRGSGNRLAAIFAGTSTDKGDDPDADEDRLCGFRSPEVPEDYWNDLSITLTEEEAEFLRDQIVASVPNSLLGQILMDDEVTREVIRLSNAPEVYFEDFANLPFIARLDSEHLRQTVRHASDFWTLMSGAHIRYNCLLQKRFGSLDLREQFEREWADWCEAIAAFDWSSWRTDFLWQIVARKKRSLKEYTQRFIKDWVDQARRGVDVAVCDRLVTQQEQNNKKTRSRLRPGFKDFRAKEWIGLSQLEYRLPQVTTMVRDIHRTLTGEADPDAGR